jgi:serine/threonine protein kinase
LPSRIGNYEFGKTLGKGTFGKVKEGVHIPTGEKVAIKIIDKSSI